MESHIEELVQGAEILAERVGAEIYVAGMRALVRESLYGDLSLR